MADLNGKRIAVLATDMFEQVELVRPRKALEDAGAETELVSLEEGEIQGFDHYDKADTFTVDRTVDDVSVRPFTTSASTSVQGPWQIAPIGFACSTKARTKLTASSSFRSRSGFATPPGRSSAS